MNKVKSGLLFFVAIFFAGILNAQTIEEGKKFMYYEKFKSAKDVFKKLADANPNNTDAVYWLGQSMILPEENNDIAGAKDLYQKTLMNNSNSPLLLVGMGHIELLEGKVQDAKNRFETAISLSQGKNKDVLNAVGFANVQAEKGDADYAIQKLRQATELKKMTDPDVWGNLGDAYRKLIQGGPAQIAYETALTLNPNYARASYRIGKIYQSQGRTQEELYLKYYNEAIAKDAAYAPVYQELYQYYYLTNVTKSAEYLEKYLANVDADPRRDCYYRASMKYAQGLFAESISTANGCISSAGAEGPYPNVYGIMGYAYDRLGDSVNAKASFEKYFAIQKPEKIGPTDYAKYGDILMKFPDSTGATDSIAGIYFDKAVSLDSTEKGKVDILKSVALKFESRKDFKKAADWHSKVMRLKSNPSKTDLYYAGYNYFRAGEYASAIPVFDMYGQKFPDDAFGFYMLGKSKWAIDSTLEQGLANADFEKAIAAGVKDSVKYKNQLVGSYKYFIVYSVFKKDKATALGYADKVLSLDPADAETIKNKEIIPTINFNAPAQKPKPAPATKAGAGAKAGKK